MADESVKGSLVLGAAVTVRHLRNAGRISPEALEARLSGEALELIDAKIAISRWYPIRAFCELLDVDWEISGAGDAGYMEAQGDASAARMFESKMYQQLDFAERSEKVETRAKLARQARLITTITGTLFNFLDFRVVLDAKDLEIIYGNAGFLNDALLHTTVGFMNRINEQQGSRRRWTGRRTAPDEMRFRLPLPAHLCEA